MAVLGSALAETVLWAFNVYPGDSFRYGFTTGVRIALIVSPIVLIVVYCYETSRIALEDRATELENAVESGSARLRFQDEEFQRAREIQEGLLPKEPAAELQSALLNAVTNFCGGNFRDDATLLVIAVV